MKKLLKCALALTIVVCILISATAMAAGTNVYNLSFSISEVSGANMTGHSSSGVLTMQSGDESLINCVAQYIAANKSKLRPFDSDAMADLLTKLLDSYDGSNWLSLLDGEMAAATYSSAAFKNVIRSRSSIDSFGVGTGYITFLNSVEGDAREGVTYRISVTVSLYQSSNPFTDVTDPNSFYYDAVMWAVRNGITVGTSPTTFSPFKVTTRAEMVTFLWRASGSPDSVSHINPFNDVKYGDFCYEAVLWGYENGYVFGTTPTTFAPDMVVTRSQAVTFIARMDGVKDSDVGYTHSFKDVKTGDYFNNAVAWAASNGITYGTSVTTFTPLKDCSRAEIVTFLYRYFVEYKV